MSTTYLQCLNKACKRHNVIIVDPSKNGDKVKCEACKRMLYEARLTEIPDDADVLIQLGNELAESNNDDRNLPLYTRAIAAGSRKQKETKPDDTFTCNPDVLGCPIAEAPKVQVPLEFFNDWVFLCNEFDTEWIAYLHGHEVEGEPNTWVITEYYFPKQHATGAHVDAEEGEIEPNTIGSIHSHVGMNAFFSGEDEAHFNHPVEMVLNRRGDIKAAVRQKLECGRFQRCKEAQIVITDCEEQLDLVEQLKGQLTARKYSSEFTTSSKQ